ncbi:DUF5908 family protein [Echinicola jeungdonensis]|uniref:DUF5908 family protein n=1 Tax=Echinicola jeungdonensis TaxID=709343 RepID=A0ABV5J9F3_9BACT|nr:DUF5908 family protein [Echinicola jeungdonensis]MDN3670821.1 DUF5908 family protein [Echinicola jeungdonensis]
MPIEIKELHIKIKVDENQDRSPGGGFSPKEKQKLIDQCIEQILEVLGKQKER